MALVYGAADAIYGLICFLEVARADNIVLACGAALAVRAFAAGMIFLPINSFNSSCETTMALRTLEADRATKGVVWLIRSVVLFETSTAEDFTPFAACVASGATFCVTVAAPDASTDPKAGTAPAVCRSIEVLRSSRLTKDN